MGLTVALEYEHGDAIDSVGDPTNLLHRLLPPPESREFRCLNRVDWYGDTVFNRMQMADVVDELQRIRKNVSAPAEEELIDKLTRLAVRGQTEPHLYLKFYGD